MSGGVTLTITDAGRTALANAVGNAPVVIAAIGLTSTAFDAVATMTAIPGEFVRSTAVSGVVASAGVAHLTARDDGDGSYALRGFGLYLADGSLFAAYGQATPIFEKASVATFLLALDIQFANDEAALVSFGDSSFAYPPSTPGRAGIARLALQAEVDGGASTDTIVTPATLAVRLTALANAILAIVAGMIATAIGAYVPLTQRGQANGVATLGGDGKVPGAQLTLPASVAPSRTVATSGLAKGGGTLASDLDLHVDAATLAEAIAGAAADVVITPPVLDAWLDAVIAGAAVPTSHLDEPGWRIHADGYIEQWGSFPGPITSEGSRYLSFGIPFPNVCFGIGGTIINSSATTTGSTQIQEVSVGLDGATVMIQNHQGGGITDANGGFRWRATGR